MNLPPIDRIPEVRDAREFLDTEDLSKRVWTAEARLNQLYYQHQYQWLIDDLGVFLQEDPVLVNGVLKVPLFRNLVERGVAMVTAQPFTWRAAQRGGTADDAAAAQAATLVLQDFERVNATRLNNVTLSRSLLLTGKAFKRLYTELDFVPVEMEPELLQMYLRVSAEQNNPREVREVVPASNGNVRAYVKLPVLREMTVSPFGIYVNSGATNLEDAYRICSHEIRTVDWVRQEFPNVWQDDHGEGYVNRISGSSKVAIGGDTLWSHNSVYGTRFNARARLVNVYDYYEKMANGNWMHMIFLGRGMRTLALEETVPFHPYVGYDCGMLQDFFWTQAPATGIVDLQRALCFFTVNLMENFSRNAKDILVVPQGQRENISNDLGTIIEENPRLINSIRRIPMSTGVHQVVIEGASIIEDLMNKSFGLGDISRGVAKTHQSPETLQLAMSSDSSVFGKITENVYESERALRRKVVQFAKDESLFDEPRFVAMAGGQSGVMLSRAVRAADLRGVTDVEMVDTIELPRDPKSRVDWSLGLLQRGLFPDLDSWKDFVRLGGDILPDTSTEVMERKKAQDLIEMVKEGTVVPSGMVADVQSGTMTPDMLIYVGPYQVHNGYAYGQPVVRPEDVNEVHIEELLRALRGGFIPQEVRPIAELLLHIRQQLVSEAEAQSLARQLELMAKQSVAQQAGQQALALQNAMLDSAGQGVEAKATPASGGVKSGQVRRGETPKAD